MKVGVMGAGAISDIYLKNMTQRFKNLEVTAIANRSPAKAIAKSKQYDIRPLGADQLYEDRDVEMIVNLTPVEAHAEIIERALLAGKHVYTEKTITNDLGRALELCALAESRGLYLGSAPDTFLGSALQTAREAIDAGKIGEIHSFAISANRCNDILISNFPFLRTPGTGIVIDYAVYYLTALVSLLGPVAGVSAFAAAPYPARKQCIPGRGNFGKEIPSPNEAVVSASMRLENGVIGTLHVDAESDFSDQAYFAIFGKKGILYLSDPNQFGGEVKILPNRIGLRGGGGDPTVLKPRTPYSDNCRGVGPAEMADAIEKGRPCRANGRMATHVLEVCKAVLAAAEDGRRHEISTTCTRPDPLKGKAFGVF